MAEADEKTDAAAAADEIKSRLEKSERESAILRASEAESKRRMAASAAEAARFKTQAETAQAGALASTITGLEQERDRLKGEHQQALADGEFAKVSDLQFQMSEVATKLTNAHAHKAHIDAVAKDTSKDTSIKDAPFDKEAFLSGRSPASAAWLREHDQYFTDPAFQSRVAGAHSLAVGKELKVDSPEYFAFIEKHALGEGDGDGEGESTTTRKPAAKGGKVNVAAPPSRDGNTGAVKLRPGDRYISAEMRHYAEDVCNVTAEQYYDSYLDLVKEGKIEDRFNVLSRR